MHCRNCSNEVSDKAVACPKCGLNPHSEKKFCPGCGAETNEKQVICTKCGISLASKGFSIDTDKLPSFDLKAFMKSKAFKLIIVAGVLCLGIYIVFSFMGHLSKDDAKELISKKFGMPASVTQYVQHGRIRFSGYGDQKELAIYLGLAEQKLLTCTLQSDDYYKNVYQIDITPAGEKYKVSDSSDTAGREYYICKAADKEFGEVTGLLESKDGKSATVEYTWRYSNFTPIGELFGLKQDQLKKSGQSEFDKAFYKAKAYFAKSEDGWRMTDRYGSSSTDLMQEMQDKLLRRSGNAR